MKKSGLLLTVLCCICLLAGCAAGGRGSAEGAAQEGAWIAQGHLKGESLAAADGELYAFMPKGEGPGERAYLYAVDESGKRRIVCAKEGCAHEAQGTLSDPCYAYAYATQGLMAENGALYAGSRNGAVGVVRFDPKGGEPRTILTADKEMACFLVFDGAIYYAQQDQSFGGAELAAPENGYRLMKRPLDDAKAAPQTVYERQGAIGYIACVQAIDGRLYLTEMLREGAGQEARMNIVRMEPDGGSAEIFAQNAGGHFIADAGDSLVVSVENADGTWSAVQMPKEGGQSRVLESGFAPYELCAAEGMILASSGPSLPAAPRTLRIYDNAGTLRGECALPDTYGHLLGMDRQYAYWWDTVLTGGGALHLERIDWKSAAGK